ncbi:MAG TPA: hypothetical protein VEI52_03925 [Terriglobales bacterium]|nr:hypothetical protein [Terriglobales bacterium]
MIDALLRNNVYSLLDRGHSIRAVSRQLNCTPALVMQLRHLKEREEAQRQELKAQIKAELLEEVRAMLERKADA